MFTLWLCPLNVQKKRRFFLSLVVWSMEETPVVAVILYNRNNHIRQCQSQAHRPFSPSMAAVLFSVCFPFPSLFIKNQNDTSPAEMNRLHLSPKEGNGADMLTKEEYNHVWIVGKREEGRETEDLRIRGKEKTTSKTALLLSTIWSFSVWTRRIEHTEGV